MLRSDLADKMPYNRHEVIAAVTDYCDFPTDLHVRPENIRRAPPEGWLQISQERFSSLGKTDDVIDLLKHLPYVQDDENFDPILVWNCSGSSPIRISSLWHLVQ